MQQDIFGSGGQPKKKELAIRKQGKQQLSKKQKDFNRLIKKLEYLRSEHSAMAAKLDEGLKYYTTHIHPLEQRLVGLRTACVKIFYSFYKDTTALSSNNKKVLREIIECGLDAIFGLTDKEPEDELKVIFKEVNGVSFEEMKKESFQEMKSEMEEMFEDLGLDINLGDINEKMIVRKCTQYFVSLQHEIQHILR